MRRRKFLACASATALAPLAAAAQQSGKGHRIAILTLTTPIADMTETGFSGYIAFFKELRRLGYVEGRNLVVERRSAVNDATLLPALGRALVALKPDVIVATTNQPVDALKAATTTIPVVALAFDPVGSKFAVSLARPGGNITGMSLDAGVVDEVGKRLALLKQAVPTTSRVAFLAPRWLWESPLGEAWRGAAKHAGVTLVGATFDPPADEAIYRRAFAAMVRDRVDSVFVSNIGGAYQYRRLIAELAVDAKVPAISGVREYVEAGALMAYAVDFTDSYRRAAGYVDRILQGANPAELPFQQPTKYELIINLKTAKALGLAMPPSLVGIADEVIE